MGKRANVMASVVIGLGGGIKVLPAAETAATRDMPAIEQTATVVEDIGQAADDASSVDDVAKKAEATADQLTSESDAHPSPDADPEGDDPQKELLDLAGNQEEEEQRKVEAERDAALSDREGVSDGDTVGPASPASGESTATGEESAVTPTDDDKQAQAAAEADQQRAEAAARADEESHQQAAAEDEERFAGPAEDTEPADTPEPVDSEPADETWLEDDADVDDPDID